MRQNPEFYFKIMVVRLPMALLGGLAAFTLAIAQPQQSGSAQTFQNSQAPYVAQYEGRITVRTDGTATEISTQRLKIQRPSALSQQSLIRRQSRRARMAIMLTRRLYRYLECDLGDKPSKPTAHLL